MSFEHTVDIKKKMQIETMAGCRHCCFGGNIGVNCTFLLLGDGYLMQI